MPAIIIDRGSSSSGSSSSAGSGRRMAVNDVDQPVVTKPSPVVVIVTDTTIEVYTDKEAEDKLSGNQPAGE